MIKISRFGNFQVNESAKPTNEEETKDSHSEDEWRQLTKDEKIDHINKKLEAAIKDKKIDDKQADELRKRMDKELQKSGPDKIRTELMKRAKEERDIKGAGEEGGDDASRLDKAKELVKQEVWKGYKQPIAQFWDTVYDIMAGE